MTVFEVTVIEVRDQVSDQVKELVSILEGDMTKVQLMDMLGIKSVPHFRKKYIQKSLELGVIEFTQPNSPNSPTQKYRLTEKGKHMKEIK